MRTPISGSRFKRDLKRMEKRGQEMGKLREAIRLLIEGGALPERYKDHPLTGDWKHFRDCHIEPDWVLIYKVEGNDLHLVATGTHSDLFIEPGCLTGSVFKSNPVFLKRNQIFGKNDMLWWMEKLSNGKVCRLF